MNRQSWWLGWCVLMGLGLAPNVWSADPLPKVTDPRLKIELFAEHPQIVTPTGMDIDHQGRIWAIESNTHFPPEGYQGHKTDRLLVMRDTDGDGKADEVKVFADELIHSMSVAVRPLWFPVPVLKTAQGEIPTPKFSVYVATRREILLLHDDNGDLKADRREQLVHLETAGDYPHDGLAGISFDGLGSMYFGLGENLGADYKIIGSDGNHFSGGGEGGSIYRCRLDGSQLTRWATGFWNPHAMCVDAFGRLFSIDNDADSRPPCRLLHIIPGGDYGYRYRNGRKGLHPFTAWNGEIPGTLPMVAGTGEAPSGIVAYESNGLPPEYWGNLLVGSWGDHRIDRFQLKAKGASFTSLAEPLVVGNENFRPVGLAVAPDGSLYFTDWVLREYKLHGQGRIWRVSSVRPNPTPAVSLAAMQDGSIVDLYGQLSSPVLPVRRMAATLLRQSDDGLELLVSQIVDRGQKIRSRLEAFWAAANASVLPQPPTKLLLSLRSLAAARSLAGGGSGGFGGAVRSLDDVSAAALWLSSDTAVRRNPVLDNLLRLIPKQESNLGRGVEERGGPALLPQLAVELIQPIDPAEILPPRTLDSAQNRFGAPFRSTLDDPFVLSLTVDRLAQVSSLEQFRNWWDTWQKIEANPANPSARAGFERPTFDRPEVAGLNRQLQTRREDQMRHARTALVLAARRKFPQEVTLLKSFLTDSEPLVRRLAVQWVAELKLKDLRPEVEAVLKGDKLDSDLFLATLAALEMLDGVSPVDFDKTPASKYVLPLVMKDGPATVRKLALRLVSPADPALTPDLFNQFLSSPDGDLRLEAIRTLQLSALPGAADLLRGVASDAQQPAINKAEAIAGLSLAAKSAEVDSPIRKLLDQTVLGTDTTLRNEALRTLRGTAGTRPSQAILELAQKLNPTFPGSPAAEDRELAEQLRLAWGDSKPALPIDFNLLHRPTQTEGWYQLAGVALSRDGFQPGLRGERRANNDSLPAADPAAGRRTFFHLNSAGCAKCHTIDGRGGKVGPDLTTIARTMDLTKLAQSILEPSREIAPQFVAWTLELKSGRVVTGLILSEESEKLKIGLPDGQTQDFTLNDIETRTPQSASLMPEKLIEQLTMQEFRDLLAYLETLK